MRTLPRGGSKIRRRRLTTVGTSAIGGVGIARDGQPRIQPRRFVAEEIVRRGLFGKLAEHLVEFGGRTVGGTLPTQAQQPVDLDGIGDFGERFARRPA